MSRRLGNDLKGSLIVPVGWLFADLLLALAMLFLLSTVGSPPKPKPTPTPKAVIATPTPTTTLRIVESTYCQIMLTVDPGGLLSNSPDAIATVEKQIRGNLFLHGRRAGLAIVYGGASGDTDTAQNIARQIYKVLGILGKQNFVFIGTSYFDPLFLLNNDSSIVAIDIYLLVRPGQKHETCGNNHQPL